MFVQSNDGFFVPDENGTPLVQTGDVTADIKLWGAGTEGDETPGAGPTPGRPRRVTRLAGASCCSATIRRADHHINHHMR